MNKHLTNQPFKIFQTTPKKAFNNRLTKTAFYIYLKMNKHLSNQPCKQPLKKAFKHSLKKQP